MLINTGAGWCELTQSTSLTPPGCRMVCECPDNKFAFSPGTKHSQHFGVPRCIAFVMPMNVYARVVWPCVHMYARVVDRACICVCDGYDRVGGFLWDVVRGCLPFLGMPEQREALC